MSDRVKFQLCCIFTVVLLVLGMGACRGNFPPSGQPQVCQEDMSCWNCQTMGNHVCGPVKD